MYVPDVRAIKFMVADRDQDRSSYAWRMWSRGSSFYVKPLSAPVAARKFSLHGPDARHSRPGFKLEVDGLPDGGGVEVATGVFTDRFWFEGEVVNDRVRRVLRLRVTADLLHPRYPSAPRPQGDLKSSEQGLVAPPPRPLRAVDLDLFVCERRPYWPHERRARKDNACLGPLQNSAGQHLTGVSVNRSVVTDPTPLAALAPPPAAEEDRVRGIAFTLDERGFVWAVEQWMSRAWLVRSAAGTL